MTKLPHNLSMLKNLTQLSIAGNPIENIEQTVDTVLSVGPTLQILNIDLHEEEQVDYLLRTLEHLQILNGIKVEREALFSSSSEDEDHHNPEENTEFRALSGTHSNNKVIPPGTSPSVEDSVAKIRNYIIENKEESSENPLAQHIEINLNEHILPQA